VIPEKMNPALGGAGQDNDENSLSSRLTLKPASRKAKKYETVDAVLALLVGKWPACFSLYERKRKPLKIGIHKDIMTALDGAITEQELSVALACYTANLAYLKTCALGKAKRIDLDGKVAGRLSEEEVLWAKWEIRRRGERK
jgi:ProP effector